MGGHGGGGGGGGGVGAAFGKPYGGAMAHAGGRPSVQMYRGKGNKVQLVNSRGQKVGPVQSNVAPAMAYAISHGYRP